MKQYYYLFVSNPFEDVHHALIIAAANLRELRRQGYSLLFLRGRYNTSRDAISASQNYSKCHLVNLSPNQPIQQSLF